MIKLAGLVWRQMSKGMLQFRIACVAGIGRGVGW